MPFWLMEPLAVSLREPNPIFGSGSFGPSISASVLDDSDSSGPLTGVLGGPIEAADLASCFCFVFSNCEWLLIIFMSIHALVKQCLLT